MGIHNRSLGWHLFYGWLFAGLVALGLFLVSECATVKPAHASEFYLDLGAGLTLLNRDAPDGVWVQNGLRHKTDMLEPALRLGAGYRFNPKWSVQAYWTRLGQARISADFVDDPDYDPHAGKCLNNCNNPYHLEAHDTMQGAELSVTRTFLIEPVQPFVRLGAGAFYHHLQVRTPATPWTTRGGFDLFGWIPTGVLGIGAKYKSFALETTYYQSIGGNCGDRCGWPFASNAFVTMLSVQIPLGG